MSGCTRDGRARRNGARISRVYVVSPYIGLEQYDKLLRIVEKHRGLSEAEGGNGKIEIKAIYCEDVPKGCRGKDFAIFGGTGGGGRCYPRSLD